MMRKYFSLACIWLAATSASAMADDQSAIGMAKPWQIDFQPPATPVMERLEWLHNHFLLGIITIIALFVLLLTLFICVRFSRKLHPKASSTTHNTTLEVVWTVIPVMVLVAIAVPSLRTHYYLERVPDAEMTVKVLGHQWYWSYEYPDQGGISFDSYIVKKEDLKPGQVRLLSVDNPLVVPVNTVVRVQLTGADVIHSWAVPAFGVKKDAVPGRLNETWFKATKTGVFYGQCSELCGVGHGFMPVEVRVVNKDEFAQWVKEKQGGANAAPTAEQQKTGEAAPIAPAAAKAPEAKAPEKAPEAKAPASAAKAPVKKPAKKAKAPDNDETPYQDLPQDKEQ